MNKQEFIERYYANLEPMTLEEFETDLDAVIQQAIADYEAGKCKMKTIISKIEALMFDYPCEHNEALDAVIEILQSHPVIHAKALKKKGTDKWYMIGTASLPFIECDLPEVADEDWFCDMSEFYPPDAILVDLIILEQ